MFSTISIWGFALRLFSFFLKVLIAVSTNASLGISLPWLIGLIEVSAFVLCQGVFQPLYGDESKSGVSNSNSSVTTFVHLQLSFDFLEAVLLSFCLFCACINSLCTWVKEPIWKLCQEWKVWRNTLTFCWPQFWLRAG